MLSLERIEHALSANEDVSRALDDLGTSLRDPEFRKSPDVARIIPNVISQFSSDPALVIRVLVNFTADNDENRRQLVQDDQKLHRFWESALNLLQNDVLGALVVVLLTQFVLNIDDAQKSEYLEFFVRNETVDALVEYCGGCGSKRAWDELELALELLVEYSAHDPLKFTARHIAIVLETSRAALATDEETLDVILLHSSQIVGSITNVSELTGTDNAKHSLVLEIYKLMNEIPHSLENIAHTKRKLFASCGNISSLIDYDNFADIEVNLQAILNMDSDLYVAAAAAILIGNCVSSRETQTQALQQISAFCPTQTLVESILTRKFGDVVQYQFLHLFNNLMTEEVSSLILGNYTDVLRITKVVVDNCKYYKEIGGIYVKFLKKLLNFSKENPFKFSELWEYIGTSEPESGFGEVDLLLLQKISVNSKSTQKQELSAHRNLVQRSITESLRISQTIDGNQLLERLKTLAMLFQNIPCELLEEILGTELFVSTLSQPLHTFMSQVLQSVSPAAQNSESALEIPESGNLQQRAILNNLKFVAAVALPQFTQLKKRDSFFDSSYASSLDSVCLVCSAVVSR